jgi:hypothetical protein
VKTFESKKNDEFAAFSKLATSLLKVPHSEIKAKLDEEKAVKKRKKSTNSFASRGVNGRAGLN